MIRLAVVQCPATGVEDPPLGPAQLAGFAAHCNHQARAFDLNIQLYRASSADERGLWRAGAWEDRAWAARLARSWEDRLDLSSILSSDPQAVVFWVVPGSEWFTLEVAGRLKARNAAAKVFLAGPYFGDAASVDAMIAEPCVDGVMAGPVDDLLPKLLGLCQACGRWVALPGFTLKQDGALACGGRPVPFTFDWDLAPSPDFSGFEPSLYEKPDQLPILASRGCPWSCPRCARDYWGKFSFKSGDRLFGEVAENLHKRPSWRHARFHDVIANARPDALRRLARMLLEHGLPERGLTWSMRAEARPEMDEDMLELLRSAGCAEIDFVEKESDHGLMRIGRLQRV